MDGFLCVLSAIGCARLCQEVTTLQATILCIRVPPEASGFAIWLCGSFAKSSMRGTGLLIFLGCPPDRLKFSRSLIKGGRG